MMQNVTSVLYSNLVSIKFIPNVYKNIHKLGNIIQKNGNTQFIC